MIVQQKDLVEAMIYWERAHIEKHGPLDGVNLPKECSKLADLLGLMWFENENEAQIPDGSEVAALVTAAASRH